MRSTGWFGTKGLLAASVTLGLTASVCLSLGDTPTSVASAATEGATSLSPAASAAPATSAARATTATQASAATSTPQAASGTASAAKAPLAASAPTAAAATTGTGKPVFVTYYLWWSASHWQDRLGSAYPIGRTPAPLPATLDANGCSAHSNYTGNTLTDVATSAGYDQNSPGTIERDVRLAASLGVKGFAVNWNGTGSASQTVASSTDNQKLQSVFDAVHKINAEGTPFRLMLSYKASARKLTTTAIKGDLSYFSAHYGADPAMDHSYSTRPEMIWAGSWKYSPTELSTVSGTLRSKLFLIGDEKPSTWTASRAAVLDGASYYWSSQDPWANPASFGQIKSLADAVHRGTNPDGRTKTWLAPFTPGYNAQLLYGTTTCVQRRSGATMHELFRGNKASNPDGWTFISWNEIAEGSYIVPLTRYGSKYTDELKTLIANNG